MSKYLANLVPGVCSFDIIRFGFKVYGHNQIVSWNEYLPAEPKIIYPCLLVVCCLLVEFFCNISKRDKYHIAAISIVTKCRKPGVYQ